ncbi:MAG: MBL fold metallo-hydrolase [Bacteroidales bacterium]|nr:MBL fold metallo-hydrolase [Bacteroidales bacterium]MBN2819286.1 MBL fold metallo-hydrolase [Bacteroidales bacterium]
MENKLNITFLGTGTSQGIPIIGCDCEVCRSADARNKRLRTSILINYKNKNIVVDTGPDFRQQMLNAEVKELRAILFTHEHKDHVAGLDDVRPFNFKTGKPIDVYAEQRVQDAIKREYAYIFSENPYPGIPQINMHLISHTNFNIDDIEINPIRVMHHKLPILGFKIGKFAYLTDIKTLPGEEKKKVSNLDAIVVTALRKEPHISHMNIEEAVTLIRELNPKKAYLTHLSHRFGLHEFEEKKLPPNVFIAYDGLRISI